MAVGLLQEMKDLGIKDEREHPEGCNCSDDHKKTVTNFSQMLSEGHPFDFVAKFPHHEIS